MKNEPIITRSPCRNAFGGPSYPETRGIHERLAIEPGKAPQRPLPWDDPSRSKEEVFRITLADKMAIRIARHLPDKVMYWAVVRVTGYVSDRLSDTIPEPTIRDILRAWRWK